VKKKSKYIATYLELNLARPLVKLMFAFADASSDVAILRTLAITCPQIAIREDNQRGSVTLRWRVRCMAVLGPFCIEAKT